MNIEYVILIGAGIVAVCNSSGRIESGRSNSGWMIRIRYCPSLSLSFPFSIMRGFPLVAQTNNCQEGSPKVANYKPLFSSVNKCLVQELYNLCVKWADIASPLTTLRAQWKLVLYM